MPVSSNLVCFYDKRDFELSHVALFKRVFIRKYLVSRSYLFKEILKIVVIFLIKVSGISFFRYNEYAK